MTLSPRRFVFPMLAFSLCCLALGSRQTEAFPTCATCLQGKWFGLQVSSNGGFSVTWDIDPYENRHFQGTMLVFDGFQEYHFDIAGTEAASGRTIIIGKGDAGLVLIVGDVSEVTGGHIFQGMLTAHLVDGRRFSVALELGND